MATHSSILAWIIPKDRGAWRAAVHGVAESDMTKQLSMHACAMWDTLKSLHLYLKFPFTWVLCVFIH